ncbi:hypothetical protein BGW80DRAFT_1249462 [Lactifluus volemus]|nr:hypothetical protein BGW80DRAFT_1249462 [Lactifluus volemus]
MDASKNHCTSDVNNGDDSTPFAPPLLTQDTRDVLKQLDGSTYHLSSASLLDHVQWAPSGRRYILVTKDKTHNKFSPVQLECVAEINPEKFWLYACGGWSGEKGPTGNWSTPTPFEKAKARGHLRRPQHPDLHHLWPNYMANLDAIVTLATSTSKDTRMDHKVVENKEIKIRHSIFLNDLDDEFTTKAMPCKTKAAKEALAEIVRRNVYDFNPLPATDTERDPIPPSQYESELSGATVLATFTLSCERWQRGWQFYADVQALTVLCEPPSFVEQLSSTTMTMGSKFEVPEVARKRARRGD